MLKSVIAFFVVLMLLGTASGATVSMESLEIDSEVEAPIDVNSVRDLGCGELNISYDPSVVHVSGASEGDVGVVTCKFDNEAGWVYVNTFGTGVSGNVTFAHLDLEPVGNGESELNITVISLSNTSYEEVNYTVSNGEVTVSSLKTRSSGGSGGGGGGGSTFVLSTPTPTPTSEPSVPPSNPEEKETDEETEDGRGDQDVTPTPTPAPTPNRVISGPQITLVGAVSAVLLLVVSYVLLRKR